MSRTSMLLLGGFIGAGVGYFVGCVIVEIIAIKEWNAKNDTDGDGDYDYHDDNEYNPPGDRPSASEQKIVGASKLKVQKNYSDMFKNRPDIAALAEKYAGKKSEEEDEDEEYENDLLGEDFDMPEDNDTQEISIVSLEEFSNAEGFQFVTLNYYDDDVVTDERDNPIDHPEQLLGDDALVSFGELSGDEDVVYVRNLRKKAIYEVVRTNKNYAVQDTRRERRSGSVRRSIKEEDSGEDNT